VGRHGIVAMPHVMAALGMGQSVAYDRVASCIGAGLLERLDLLRSEPSILRATRDGLRYAGLGLGPAVVSPGAVDHWLRCATTARLLAEEFGPGRVITERELAFAERQEGRPIASAKIGELPDGRPRLHRPDLVVVPDGHPLIHPSPAAHARTSPVDSREADPSVAAHARTRERGREITSCDERALAEAEDVRADSEEMRVISVEVELTPKSPKRLREIIRGWRRANWVTEVRYHCEPGQTRRAVERAVDKLHAGDRISISEAVPRVRSEQASPLGNPSCTERSASRCSK
jgi:hypothetical protein